MTTYKIIRMYQSDAIQTQTIKRGLSITEAQTHCSDLETSSKTATQPENVKRTKRCGLWFDGYTEDTSKRSKARSRKQADAAATRDALS